MKNFDVFTGRNKEWKGDAEQDFENFVRRLILCGVMNKRRESLLTVDCKVSLLQASICSQCVPKKFLQILCCLRFDDKGSRDGQIEDCDLAPNREVFTCL